MPKAIKEIICLFIVLGLIIGGYLFITHTNWQKFGVTVENRSYLAYCDKPISSSDVSDFLDLVIERNSPRHMVVVDGIKNRSQLYSDEYKYVIDYWIECTDYYDDGHVKSFTITPLRNETAEAIGTALFGE